MKTRDRQLMWLGMFLFLLGLLTGLAEESFANVRMGLSADGRGSGKPSGGRLGPSGRAA